MESPLNGGNFFGISQSSLFPTIYEFSMCMRQNLELNLNSRHYVYLRKITILLFNTYPVKDYTNK